MESFSTALLLLIAISVVLLVYVIYIFFDQRSNLRFASPKSKWAPLIALVLIVIGFGNYFYNGQRTEDLGAAFVLVIFALMMAIGRMTRPYSCGLKAPYRLLAMFQIRASFSRAFLPTSAIFALL